MKKVFVIFGENSEETKIFCPDLFDSLTSVGINFGVIRVPGVSYKTALEIIKEKIGDVSDRIILYAGTNLKNLTKEKSFSGLKYDLSQAKDLVLAIFEDKKTEEKQQEASSYFSENILSICTAFDQGIY